MDTFNNMLLFTNLPPHIQAVFIQNVLKLFARIIDGGENEGEYYVILELCDFLSDKMKEFVKSAELEVQERANTALVIVSIVRGEMEKSKQDFEHDGGIG